MRESSGRRAARGPGGGRTVSAGGQNDQCPTSEQLERWLQQAGQGAEDHPLAAHVDACPRCQQLLEGLTADTAVRLPPAPLPSTAPPVLRRPDTDLHHAGRSVGTADEVLTVPGEPAGSPSAGWRLEQGTRALLHRRLRVFSLVLVVVFVGAAVLYLDALPAVHRRYTDRLGAVMIFAASTCRG